MNGCVQCQDWFIENPDFWQFLAENLGLKTSKIYEDILNLAVCNFCSFYETFLITQ